MTSLLAAGQVLAARYELVRPLTAGQGAETWLARETATARESVLRVRTVDAGEGRLRATVSHPALLAPVEQFEWAGRAVDVYPRLEGGESGRLRGRAWPLVVRRLLPVAEALAAIHDAGWVHGDVKASNVLLDADGLARLADLGSARRRGDEAAAGSSPYSTSPERLAGAPADAADDIYAFGVLLYELIGGHPPFYPDVTPARVRDEVPPPLAGRPVPPDDLREFVARCLAKDPAARPASMREAIEELQRCLASEDARAAEPAAASTGFTPRPPTDALPIEPGWRRPAGGTAPTADQLRREGFRKGLLVAGLAVLALAFGFTFFVLPDLVASNKESTAAPAAVAPSAKQPEPAPVQPEVDLAQQAELKRQAEERRPPLPARLQALEARDVASWGGEPLKATRTALADGDAAMTKRDFRTALAKFEAVASGLAALEKRANEVLHERLAAAKREYDAGRSAAAQAHYQAALRISPNDATARAGLARAKVLDDVVRETVAAERAEQSGDAAGATAAYRRALALDSQAERARVGLARVQARAVSDAYAAALGQAQAALARGDAAAAQAAFERAERVRPGTSEVAEGLAQLRRTTETRTLAATLDRASAAERAERWSEALGLYREALKGDPSLAAAQSGVERVEPRAMLDAELQAFLDRPERLYSQSGREAARGVIARATSMPSPGPRLAQQSARMQEMLAQAETPIRIALASDNATDVQIYRIGKLGAFEHRDLDLMPGRYTVVGTRQGYRDVRKELNLLPGAAPPTLVVRCEEPI